ncbi:MAG: DUF2339 domain-containing protein [Chloroflexota bacterium]|nr:DUF2339 domain-containing protein [Chloroflexota bacterium]
MNGDSQGEDHVALLERRMGELDERLQHIEAWSVETYQYQYAVRPNPTLNPPAPRWQRRDVAPWPAQTAPPYAPATPPIIPATPRPVAQPGKPYSPPQPIPAQGVAPLWQPIANLFGPPRPPAPAAAPVGAPPGRPIATLEQRPYHAPAPAARRWSFSDVEQLLSGRGLAWTGGLAILLGALFFLGLAFTRGWIGPAGRVGIGVVAGLALVGGGAWFFERREALFGHVLLAVGLGTTSIALIAATRLYHLVPAGFGLFGALVIALAAAVVAIRADVQVVAGYGLVTALAAPPLMGATPNPTTIAFLTAALIGTTAIALYRTWNWLPTVAFLLSAPQLAGWLLDDAPRAAGLVALAGFWALNTLAAGGAEFRVRRNRLSATSATSLLATAAFLLSVGFAFLDRTGASDGHGLFLLIIAAAYGAVGAYFLRTAGRAHPFGLLATGTGIAALTMAIPVQFGGPVVPVAWAAEATALAWVYSRLRHRFSGIAAIVLGVLAVLHLVTVKYPLPDLFSTTARHAFLDSAGMTLAFLLLAGGVAAAFIRVRPIRATLAFVGIGLVAYAMPFETTGIALLTGWATLLVLIVAAERLAPLAERRLPSLAATTGSADLGPWLRGVSAAMVGVLALLQMYAGIFAHVFATGRRVSGTPFTDQRTLATAIVIAAGLIVAALTTKALVRRATLIAPFAFAALLLPTEIGDAATVVGWSALAVGLCLIARRDRAGNAAYLGAAAALLGVAFSVAFAVVAPLSRLAVHAMATGGHTLFLSGATAALGAIVAALVVAAWQYRAERFAPWLAAAAGAIAVYLLSVGIVDEFQRHVMTGTTQTSLASLQKQAQVTLSIVWALLGGAAFVVGLVRRLAALRIGGLALLGIATVKVFLFDLASLDATYKVPSLIGLGILLLASSYVYQRLKPRDDTTNQPTEERTA